MWYLTRILAQLQIIGAHVVTIGRIIWSYARTHRRNSVIFVSIAVVAVGTLIYFTSGSKTDLPVGPTQVSLLRVGDISGKSTLTVLGEVRSTSEALVAPDISGAVQGVYRSLGDFVEAGAIIAELKNDGQRASVAQARAALDKVKSGVSVGGIGIDNAKNSFISAQNTARATIDAAYGTMDSTVHKSADSVFSNPESSQPKFIVTSSNSQTILTAQSNRLAVQTIFKRHQSASSPQTYEGLIEELSTLSTEASSIHDLLSNTALALNGAIATNGISDATIAAYRLDINGALASINALRASLVSSTELLQSKKAAVSIAEQSLSQGATGESADITAAEANVASAVAQLEKTIIRAPISGTINKLDLDVGSFVNASVPVVYISNKRGLEATVFISERDIHDVAIGARALVSGIVEGKVVRVAQALDPITKKAEVRIALPSDAPLVSGQSASIEITRSKKVATASSAFTIPIASVKITPNGAVVFTVSNNILEEHPISLGTLQGSNVEVLSGLTNDMNIVSDARGLKTGQTVSVK